jgi:predicted TIM-barrel fold metal-dependent hydrolase
MAVDRPFGIVDADGHISDSIAAVKEFIEAPYENWGYRLGGSDGFDTAMGGVLGSKAPDATSWLDALERGGMERAVLYPTGGLAYGLIGDKDAAVAICKAYNRFFADRFHGQADRLYGVATLPLQDIDEAIVELRAAKELGFVGGMLPAIARGPLLGDARYFPLYEEAQRLGMMLAVHGATHGLDQVGSDVYDQFIAVHTYTFPAAIMRQFTSVVYAGISELFPDLRIGWMESGCTWLPFWIDRMDSEWHKRGAREAPALTRLPSEAIRGAQWFFHAESEESLIPAAAAYLGVEKLFWASDWPHWDNEYPESLDEMLDRGDLDAGQKLAMLRENALRLYGMA